MAGLTKDFRWDEFQVSEFFLHDAAPFDLEDDEGQLYRASDGRLVAEVIVLPIRGVVCFTIRDVVLGHIIMDIAFQTHSELCVRRGPTGEYLYCHECVALPGIHSYRTLHWHTFFQYFNSDAPLLSIRFTWNPHISLQLIDIVYDNRA